MNELTELIEQWAIEKELDISDPYKQTLKLLEEAGELSEGILKGKDEQVVDSLGDIYVVITILANQLGLSIEECTRVAYDEIKERAGEMRNGTFVKADDL